MKQLATVIILLTIGSARAADSPKDVFVRLENLRQGLVISRAVLDEPQGKLARKCGFKIDMIGSLGGALESRFANELPEANEFIGHEKRLKKAVSHCVQRGSCSLYARISESAKGMELAEELRKIFAEVSKSAEKESAETIRGAVKTVPAPCKVLKSLI